MHPEDDLTLNKMIELIEKEVETDKELIGNYLKSTEELIEKINESEMPPHQREYVNGVLRLIEQIGKNRVKINETQYYLFLALRNINRDISDIHDTLAGFSKHR